MKPKEPIFVDDAGKPADLSVLEESGTAFDPTQTHLDLTKDEKRRTTALMMAIQAYDKLIIKDAEMYEAINRDRVRTDGSRIQPATINSMVEAAISFDAFIAGKFTYTIVSSPPQEGGQPLPSAAKGSE